MHIYWRDKYAGAASMGWRPTEHQGAPGPTLSSLGSPKSPLSCPAWLLNHVKGKKAIYHEEVVTLSLCLLIQWPDPCKVAGHAFSWQKLRHSDGPPCLTKPLNLWAGMTPSSMGKSWSPTAPALSSTHMSTWQLLRVFFGISRACSV